MQGVSIEKKQILKKCLNYLFLFLFSFSVDYFLNATIGFYSVIFFFMFVIVLFFSKRLFYLSILVTGLLTVLYIPVSLQYGPPSFSMSVALFYTDKKEALSFILGLPIKTYLFSIFFGVFSIFVAKQNYEPLNYKLRYLILFTTLLFALVIPMYILITKNTADRPAFRTYVRYGPAKFLYENVRNYFLVKNENLKIQEILSKKDSWEIDAVYSQKQMYIVVIGESVRKDFMNSYGFRVKNTPFMSSSNGTIFNNFISSSYGTVPSLLRMICLNNSSSYVIENNIVTLAKKSGFYTHWFSNQGYVGVYNTPISSIGRLSDENKFIQYGNDESRVSYDYELLPWIKNAVFDNSKNIQLIVVHLYGSHFSFCDRTKGEYDEFVLNKNLSCYIQSIKNTDKLLEDIYFYAMDSRKTFNMIYFSDHGLSFNDDYELLHSDKYKANYDVPFFVWSDDALLRDSIFAARSGMDFLTFFSEIAGIEEKNLKRTYKFVSNEIAPIISILNRNKELCPYQELEDDLEKMQKLNVR